MHVIFACSCEKRRQKTSKRAHLYIYVAMMHRAFVGKGDQIIQLDTAEQLQSKSILRGRSCCLLRLSVNRCSVTGLQAHFVVDGWRFITHPD